MKTPSKPFPRRGFTLIELLVVITIIAILAAAGFTIGPALMNKARMLSAQAGANTISNSVEQFYTEYSALPDPGAAATTVDTEYTTDSADGLILLNILSGTIVTGNTGDDQNPRKIRFLSVKTAKNGADGLIYDNNGSITAMYDPWGQPYYIMLDYDYDERMTVDPVDGTAPDSDLNGRRVAAYSLGVKVPSKGTEKSLVKTW
jgi:prepilin-type N-terminal cleavage/methylation domain-containing protein